MHCSLVKIPLCSFRWEEVETWSRMESPRVLQLYGAVREGPNVILFMDLKRGEHFNQWKPLKKQVKSYLSQSILSLGSLAQLLRVRGRLSEELALYYHAQVLQALEHLHSRRVVHLDVKGLWHGHGYGFSVKKNITDWCSDIIHVCS